MKTLRRGWLFVLAAGLASITAGIHLYLSLTELVQYVTAGHTPEFLSVLFALSALAIIAGMLAFYRGAPHQPIYLLGILLMLIYLIGYADWHVFGTIEGLLGLEEAGHDHTDHTHDHGHGHEEENALQLLITHLLENPFELMSKTAEALLLVILSFLYYAERNPSAETDADITG